MVNNQPKKTVVRKYIERPPVRKPEVDPRQQRRELGFELIEMQRAGKFGVRK